MRKVYQQARCENCRGAGYLESTLLMTDDAIRSLPELAKILPNEPVPVERQRCPVCEGTGRYGKLVAPQVPEG